MPQIRPITDLRNTTEISELCHARKEPIFITKNGYGDLVIMSMETYEALTAAPDAVPAAEAPAITGQKLGEMRFLTEKDAVWAGMLADVLTQHDIPFIKESSLGAGLRIRAGSFMETIRFFVPEGCLASAKELVEELFAEDEA